MFCDFCFVCVILREIRVVVSAWDFGWPLFPPCFSTWPLFLFFYLNI